MSDIERYIVFGLIGVLVTIVGYGVQQWVQGLRQTVRDNHTEREATARALHELTLALARVTDALMGFNGHGGLIMRVAAIEAEGRATRDRADDIARHLHAARDLLAVTAANDEYRDDYLEALADVIPELDRYRRPPSASDRRVQEKPA